jgi:hypothetical protein
MLRSSGLVAAPHVLAFLTGVAAAGLLAMFIATNAQRTAQQRAEQAAPAAVRVGPQALVSAGASGAVAARAAGSYALVAHGSPTARVTVVRASDGATVFTGSLVQLRRLALGRLAAGETYTVRVERGSRVRATLVAGV